MHSSCTPLNHKTSQRGAALMIMLVILAVGAVTIFVASLNSSALQIARDKTTAAALAQAKDALIGYAVNFKLSTGRPGDLPCPDINNDGVADLADAPCGGNAIGRLPWKTLGLPDLRDGSGERLWYAVSANFKNSPRTPCTNSNQTGCLNSDTEGTITVYGSDGSVLNAGNTSTGAVAVIIAPGEVLTRQGSGTLQDRSSTGVNSASNYLDIATIGGITEDNASFVDGSATDGFIQGRIKDSNGKTILNDQLLVITEYHIIPQLEKRVVAEVKNCLVEYAAIPHNRGPAPNQGYYPWAADRTVIGSTVVYLDSDSREFGHIPDQPFSQTCNDTGGAPCGTGSGGMKDGWGANCNILYGTWWLNWGEVVFYGLAHSLRPHDMTHNHVCPSATCLTVNPPSSANDKSFVVIMAGEKLTGQSRSSNADKSNLNNYLEGANDNGNSPFQQSPPSTTFNDTVIFQ